MSQSIQNLIANDQKHILDINKSYKGRLKKAAGIHLLKKFFYGISDDHIFILYVSSVYNIVSWVSQAA